MLFRSNTNKQWAEQFRQGELFAAVYPGKNQFLFLLQSRKLPHIETIKNTLKKSLGTGFVVLYKHHGNFPVTVVKIFNIKTSKSYWLWKMDGALLFSTQENLMEASISGYTMQEMHFSDDNGFKTVKKTSGKLVDARLFVYYPVLGQLFSGFTSNRFKDVAQSISRFAGWSETDLMINSTDIIFSGYTRAIGNNTLAHFKNQQPVSLNGYTLFPFNSTFSYSRGFSNFSAFVGNKASSRFKTAYQPDIKSLIKLTGIDVSLVSNALNSKEIPQKLWAVIQIKDPPRVIQLLKNLAIKSGSHKLYRSGNYIIRKINIDNFLPGIYGERFSAITQNYYCIINGFAVFANSPGALTNLIHYSETGKTLDLDENYKSFSNNLAGTSNLLIQIRPRTLLGLINYFLNKKAAASLSENYESFLKNIQGVAFQYSHGASLYYTNFYLQIGRAHV